MATNTHGTLTERIQSTVYDRTDSGNTITIVKTCNWANRDTYTPAIGSVHPLSSAYTLKTAKQEQLPGTIARITLTYVAVQDTLPETSVVEQGSTMEVDIQLHPDFSEWSADWDEENQRFKADSTKVGQTSYLVGTTTVIKTTSYASKPGSPKGDLGKRESPGGDYGSSANWLCIGATRQKIGNYWTIEKTYLYSAVEWDTDIYPA